LRLDAENIEDKNEEDKEGKNEEDTKDNVTERGQKGGRITVWVNLRQGC